MVALVKIAQEACLWCVLCVVVDVHGISEAYLYLLVVVFCFVFCLSSFSFFSACLVCSSIMCDMVPLSALLQLA
eukprot:m.189726 g.189726  ORF g.189726 m.189726 type:complete len:74 (-) comp14799_c0_seq2:230-451(-)